MAFPFAAVASGIGAGLSYLRGQESDALQKEFAKKAIRWKVADAQKAGIHPLYALGANTVSYSPSSVGDIGPNLAEMGNSIDRAMSATSTQGGRVIDASLEKLALERAGLENELLRTNIANARSAGARSQVGPPMPGTGANTPAGFLPLPPEGMLSANDAENWFGEAGSELIGLLNLDKSLTSTAWKPNSPLIRIVRKPSSPAAFVGRGAYRR